VKILIYGEFWQGTLPNLLLEEFHKRGKDVYKFDYSNFIPGISKRTLIGRIKRNIFKQFYLRIIQNALLKRVNEICPQIIIICKGSEITFDTLSKIKSTGVTLVNYNPDDFFNLKVSSLELIKSIPLYDVIISSRDHLFEKYTKYGANRLVYLDWYYVPELHFNRNLKQDFHASFVGSWSSRREALLMKVDVKIHIWGSGWSRSSLKFRRKHSVCNKILNQKEMSEIFSRTKYNINLLTIENNDKSNLRFFEVTASGGLLVTERNSFSTDMLIEGTECLMFSNVNELNDILKSDIYTTVIANRGTERIIKGHNAFSDRVDYLCGALNL